MPAAESSPATAVERALNILEAAAQRREGLTNRHDPAFRARACDGW